MKRSSFVLFAIPAVALATTACGDAAKTIEDQVNKFTDGAVNVDAKDGTVTVPVTVPLPEQELSLDLLAGGLGWADLPDPYPNDATHPPIEKEETFEQAIPLSLADDFDAKKYRIERIAIEKIKYTYADNTLTQKIAGIELYMGPPAAEKHTDPGVVKFADTPAVEPGKNDAGEVTPPAGDLNLQADLVNTLNFKVFAVLKLAVDTKAFPRPPKGSVKVTYELTVAGKAKVLSL